MSRKNEPFLGLGYGWNSGEDGWGSGYNEAIKTLSVLCNGGVETIQNDPVASPVAGKAYIVGTTPTGSWAGKANHITYWDADSTAWIFIPPRVGLDVLVKSQGDSGEWYYYGTDNEWTRLQTGGGGGVQDVVTIDSHVRARNEWRKLNNLHGLPPLPPVTVIRSGYMFVPDGMIAKFKSSKPISSIGYAGRADFSYVRMQILIDSVLMFNIVPADGTYIMINGVRVDKPSGLSGGTFIEIHTTADGCFLRMGNVSTGEEIHRVAITPLDNTFTQVVGTIQIKCGGLVDGSKVTVKPYYFYTNLGGYYTEQNDYRLLRTLNVDDKFELETILGGNEVDGQLGGSNVNLPAGAKVVLPSAPNPDRSLSPIPIQSDNRIRAVLNGQWVDITDRLNPAS